MALLFVPLLWATWGWQTIAPDSDRSLVRIDSLTENVPDADRAALGPFELQRLWRLTSSNRRFGGYSALVLMPSGQFLAASDRNSWLRFPPPIEAGTQALPTGQRLVRRSRNGQQEHFDVESLVRDPADGALWVGLENDPRVARIDKHGRRASLYMVQALRDWPENGAAEAMARLPDGRWIMLCETCGGGRGGLHLGLVFAGHPGASAPQKFGIVLPSGFDPVDMVTLPDGRLLILTRAFNLFPPRFASGIVIADIAQLNPKRPLATQELARIEGAAMRENYEGMAIHPEAGGQMAVWLISDANASALQETRLMHLRLNLAKLPQR